MLGWVVLALGAVAIARSGKGGGGGGGGSKPITSGNTLLRKGRTYRVEMTATGGVVDDAQKRPAVAKAIEEGLEATGAYDVYISPTIPMVVSYSWVTPGDTPVALGLPSFNTINGVEATYTFTSIQEIAARRAA